MARRTSIRYRDAETGEFINKQTADQMPKNTYVRERVPKPGFGDTGKSKQPPRKK